MASPVREATTEMHDMLPSMLGPLHTNFALHVEIIEMSIPTKKSVLVSRGGHASSYPASCWAREPTDTVVLEVDTIPRFMIFCSAFLELHAPPHLFFSSSRERTKPLEPGLNVSAGFNVTCF